MKTIRAGSGLGDSIYLQSIVRHLVERGERLKVCSNYPDVFRPLAGRVELAPFNKAGIEILAHYSRRKPLQDTDQFEDMAIQAGIVGPVDLRIDWRPTDLDLTQRLLADGRPVVVVQLPRAPMGRTDGFGQELLPDCRVIQRVIDQLRGDALIVQVGSGQPLFRFKGIDIDLADRTSVAQLIDVASVADGFLGYVSFLVPLAESFSRPALLVWSRLQARANTAFVRQITPKKVLHRDSSRFIFDHWDGAAADPVVAGFIAALRGPRRG